MGSIRFLTQLRRAYNVVRRRDFYEKIDVKMNTERLGSVYGGWDVAIKSIGPNSIVYSVGLGEDASFDLGLVQRFGVTVHIFDPTPKSLAWAKLQNFPKNLVVAGVGLAGQDGNASFYPPTNAENVSHSIFDQTTNSKAIVVPMKRLATLMNERQHDHVDILKMDIEGSEYEVIDDLVSGTIRPGQILVEFHHRLPGIGIKRSKEAITKLRSIGYLLFHVAPTGEEFSFILSEKI